MEFAANVLVTAFSFQLEEWSLLHFIIAGCSIIAVVRFLESLFTQDIWCNGKPFRFPVVPQLGSIRTDDQLGWRDHLFVNINREIITPCYITQMILHFKASDDFQRPFDGASWVPPLSLPLQFLALYALYDAVYVPFHRFLHLSEVYPWIHKHHHQAIVPHRGTWEGFNVHPLEFVCGAYMHLFAFAALEFILASLGPTLGVASRLHWLTVVAFLGCTTAQASLNHTLADVRVPGFYESRDHGVHHKLLKSNYFQYVRWWDQFYGSYYSAEEMTAKSLTRKVS